MSFDGTPITIAPSDGPVLLLFVAHWCPHCEKEVPLLSTWLHDGGLPAGVKAVTIATGTRENAPEYPPSRCVGEQRLARSPCSADSDDSKAALAFGLTGYPLFIAVGADGKVVARAAGEQSIAEVEALVAQIAPTAS